MKTSYEARKNVFFFICHLRFVYVKMVLKGKCDHFTPNDEKKPHGICDIQYDIFEI